MYRKMKYKWFYLVCFFLMFSCAKSKERCIFEYEYYINKVAKEHSHYTQADWLRSNNRFRSLQASVKVYEKRMTNEEKLRVLKAFNIYASYRSDVKPPFENPQLASIDGADAEKEKGHIDGGEKEENSTTEEDIEDDLPPNSKDGGEEEKPPQTGTEKVGGESTSIDAIDDRVEELKKITEQQKELFLQLQQLREQIEASNKNITPKQKSENEILINQLQNDLLMKELNEKKQGRKEIHGSIKVLVFPTNFKGQRFNMDYRDLEDKIERALNIIRTQAKRYGEDISIDYEFRVQYDGSYVSINNSSQALDRYEDYVSSFSNYDLVSVVYAIDMKGRSYCSLRGSLGENSGNAVIWYKDWNGHDAGTLAHELFHTMGADDLYYEEGVVPKEVEDNFVKLIGDSIMIHSDEGNTLDPINAWLIGWNKNPELWYTWFVDRRESLDVN